MKEKWVNQRKIFQERKQGRLETWVRFVCHSGYYKLSGWLAGERVLRDNFGGGKRRERNEQKKENKDV